MRGIQKADYQEEYLVEYLKDLKKTPLLTEAQEFEQTRAFRKAVVRMQYYEEQITLYKDSLKKKHFKKQYHLWKAYYETIKDKLVRSNLRLVISIASTYRGNQFDFADLINEGIIGLIEALQRFEPKKGFRLSTYATWWIKQSIALWVNSSENSIQFSSRFHKLLKKYHLCVQYLIAVNQTLPSSDEIAHFMNLSRKKINLLQFYQQKSLSLQQPISHQDEDLCLSDVVEDPQSDPYSEVFKVKLAETIMKSLASLTERERQILSHRYGFFGEQKLTLKETGRRFGLTRERIRQIQTGVLKKLQRDQRLSDLLK